MDIYLTCDLWSDFYDYDIVGLIDGDMVFNCVSDL
jgi:hypothetical protein